MRLAGSWTASPSSTGSLVSASPCHGGNNVIFIADFIYGVEEDLGYVLLTNSANGKRMVEPIERRVYGRDLGR